MEASSKQTFLNRRLFAIDDAYFHYNSINILFYPNISRLINYQMSSL